jgi:hypothetical protein
MIEELSEYPESVVAEVVRLACRKFIFTPSIAEMVELCEGLVKKLERVGRFLLIQSGRSGIGSISDDYLWVDCMTAAQEGPASEKPMLERGRYLPPAEEDRDDEDVD